MHHRPLTAALLIAATATLALSACTSAPPAADTAADDATATPAAAARTPLSPYWDAMYGVYDAAEEVEKRERVQQLLAECMAAEGFDYTPIDQSPRDSVGSYEEGYGSEDWVAQHGYGAFPSAEDTRQIDAQVAAEDPNQEYVAGLSETEQAAYYRAFQNPTSGRDALSEKASGEAPAYDWATAGCQGSSEHAVMGDDPTRSERYAPLVAAMNDLGQDQALDPAMAPIEAEWSECMAAAGYGALPTRQSAVDAVFAQSAAYWDSGATDEPAAETLAEWRAFEIEVALADFDCAETIGYAAKTLEVQIALENRFIDDNRAELEAMLAEVAQG